MAVQQPPSATPLFLLPRVGPAVVKRELSREELEEVRFAFETLLAGDPSGVLNIKQLKVALRAMGFPVKKADVREMLRKYGEDDSVQVNYDLFSRILTDQLCTRTVADDLHRAFQLFDIHGQGKIDVLALRKVVRSLGLEVPEAELDLMIREFDKDKDGMINQAEFMAIMTMADD